MTRLVDPDNEPGNIEELEKSLSSAVTQDSGEADVSNEPDSRQDDDPLKGTKFEGKSLKDVVESYKNLESAYGRMANDLGTQRKLTDKLLELERQELKSEKAPEYKLSPSDLLDDPNSALDKYFSAKEQAQQQKLAQIEAQLKEREFAAKYPGYEKTVQSTEFASWLQQSPIRSRAAAMAANGDWDAADLLLQEYTSSQTTSTVQDSPKENINEARKVSLQRGSAKSPDAGKAKGKVYRRADLIRLKIEKPDVYDDPGFQNEIIRAYAEGRVR